MRWTPIAPLRARCATPAFCYNPPMATKTEPKERPTALVPVTTMEELPVLSAAERAALRQSLVEAENRIRSGEFVEYDPQTFKDRLHQSHREAKQAKKA